MGPGGPGVEHSPQGCGARDDKWNGGVHTPPSTGFKGSHQNPSSGEIPRKGEKTTYKITNINLGIVRNGMQGDDYSMVEADLQCGGGANDEIGCTVDVDSTMVDRDLKNGMVLRDVREEDIDHRLVEDDLPCSMVGSVVSSVVPLGEGPSRKGRGPEFAACFFLGLF